MRDSVTSVLEHTETSTHPNHWAVVYVFVGDIEKGEDEANTTQIQRVS